MIWLVLKSQAYPVKKNQGGDQTCPNNDWIETTKKLGGMKRIEGIDKTQRWRFRTANF